MITKKVVVHFSNPEQDRVFDDVKEVIIPDANAGTIILLLRDGSSATLVMANVCYWLES